MTVHAGLGGAKVLVTGASGFIGTRLCRQLSAAGAQVHGVSRRDNPVHADGVTWWRSDLQDLSVLRRILKRTKPDLIFHLASHVHGARDLGTVLPTFEGNLASTVNLLLCSAELGSGRIVLGGSMEEPTGLGESIPPSPYAAAKWASSAYGRMFHALYDSPVVLARLFMVYGPEQPDLSKLVPYVTLSLLRGERPAVSSGLRRIDWIYIADAVDGLLALATAPNVEGATVDIGTGRSNSVRDVVERLVAIVDPAAEVLYGARADRPLERARVAEVDATYAKIGWRPRVGLDVGLARTVDWYREQFVAGARGAR